MGRACASERDLGCAVMAGEILRDVPWPFAGDTFPPQLGAVIQKTVLSGQLRALVVIHDYENDWLIGDGVNDPNEDGACAIAHISHVTDADPSVSVLADLPVGWQATRSGPDEPWERSRHHYDD